VNSSHRVALFTDTFHEVNGVALTCRQFASFASRRGLPMLRVHPGSHSRVSQDGPHTVFELAPSRLSFGFESDLQFDLHFLRHKNFVRDALERFRPDLIHVTAPGHCSILGVILAHELNIPLAASWHTNIHEFGARRLGQYLPTSITARVESLILALAVRYYRIARMIFAPNPELRSMLAARTGKPVFPMNRGVDLSLFHPRPETRPANAPLTIGYVGRLTPEKNVRLLAQLRIPAARFLIVGQGSERDWLRANLPNAELPGVLHGEALARAYASMDIFAFPSSTDTYGNVVQEAKACGVPVVVSSGGGPKYLVRHGVDGMVTSTSSDFIAAVELLSHDSVLRARMSAAAVASAQSLSWDAVFEGVYAAYQTQGSTPAPAFSTVSTLTGERRIYGGSQLR